MAKLKYEEKEMQATNVAAKQLFRLMAEKKTNLTFANDEANAKRFLELADQIGPEIAVLKTHIDLLTDFTPDLTKKLTKLAEKHKFLIFEDRKLTDIGNTSSRQYTGGIYKIADWANLVNLSVIPGPGIIDSIGEAIKGKKDGIARGILVLAQMSSEGNLATGNYTKNAVDFTRNNQEIIAGYIGDGGTPAELEKLAAMSLPGQLILTPGVQTDTTGDSKGQRYSSPEKAIMAGSDSIIVGRGIYGAENPSEKARLYREIGWSAYLKRIS